ncbi:MAG: putative glycoside hydrolase [Bacteroidales bacterium]
MKNLFVLLVMFVLLSCGNTTKEATDTNQKKVWAWMSGKTTMTHDQWDHYFRNASQAGIDAIILECHGGYPEVLGDSTQFRDSAAILIINTALEYSKAYDIELHAWIWTTNRTEMSLRNAHPEWYQVNALGQSCLDIKLYNREHYRWLCPSRPEAVQYLKERVAELAQIDGLAGVHLDFIRYPDAILPYGLHESRNVVQDKVYPQWDFCYCPVCRSKFKDQTGIDPMELEDPTANQEWMQFRWDALANMAGEVASEIKAHGKISSAAVFASPEESKKLVRQDWANFRNIDHFLPMIYHKFYDWEDEAIMTATKEGVEALKANGNRGILTSGLFVGHVPAERIPEFFGYAIQGGSQGVCLFSLEGVDMTPGYWEKLKEAIAGYKSGTL